MDAVGATSVAAVHCGCIRAVAVLRFFAIVHIKAFLQSPFLGKAAYFSNALQLLRLKRADDVTGSDFSSRGRSGGEHARRTFNGAMR